MSKGKVKVGFILLVTIWSLFLFFAAKSVEAAPRKFQALQTFTPTLVVITPTLFADSRIDEIETSVFENRSQTEILELKIQNLESSIQVQSEAYSATVSRMEANMNLLLAVMTIASILIAFLGFGFVKFWVRHLVEERVKNILSQEIKDLTKVEIENIRNEWDPKFASLYDEYRKAIPRK